MKGSDHICWMSVDEVPGQPGVSRHGRSSEPFGQRPAMRSAARRAGRSAEPGASGPPTTTSRPSEVRSTSTGVPYRRGQRLGGDDLLPECRRPRRRRRGTRPGRGRAGSGSRRARPSPRPLLLRGRSARSAPRPRPGSAGPGSPAARRAAAAGAAHQGLRDQQPLLLAAGALRRSAGARSAEAPTRSMTSLDPVLRGAAAGAEPAASGQRDAPAVAVQAEPDDVDAADAQRGVEAAALRQVADLRAGACRAAARARAPRRRRRAGRRAAP